MNLDKNNSDFSLLKNSGGDFALQGFSFQDAVLLYLLPRWLTYEGFTSCIREGLDDIEVKFFVPSQGYQKECIQVKHKILKEKEFRLLIDDFRAKYLKSPQSYQWFTIACIDVAQPLQPIVNGLRRMQEAMPFYTDDPAILSASSQDLIQRLNYDQDLALFLEQRVRVERCSRDLEGMIQGYFKEEIGSQFSIADRLLLEESFIRVKNLISSSRGKPISRADIEAQLGSYARPKCVKLFTIGSQKRDISKSQDYLVYNWERFSGRGSRNYPSTTEYNKLLHQLYETKTWIIQNHREKRIELYGDRRYSASLALGHVFGSVSEFVIDVNYKNQVWSTDMYPDKSTPPYHLKQDLKQGGSDRLAVTISLADHDIKEDVSNYLKHTFDNPHILHLWGNLPVETPQQCKRIVDKIKKYIRKSLSTTQATHIDLFIGALPSPIVIFLGHHLNAIAPIQFYEWTGGSSYVPTCYLNI